MSAYFATQALINFAARVSYLANGLRVVAHREPKTPIAAVYVAYHAGSRDELPGKHGLAHLVEHLMFCGSEHSRQNYFLPLEEIGAASVNANATDDYTAYFQAVPIAALDYALWMEAERMSCMSAALDQSTLDRQRAVVCNELRQRAAEPYGGIASLIREQAYAPEHPYAHHPYGEIEALEQITLYDVRRWCDEFHRPANATIVIAGDINSEQAIDRVSYYFESIPMAPWSTPQRADAAAGPSAHAPVEYHQPNISGRIYRVWNAPRYGADQHAALELACELLAGGEASRLFTAMVLERQIASEVAIDLQARELGSQIVLHVTAAPGIGTETVRSALDDAVKRFSAQIPTKDELEAACVRVTARFVRDTERLCGPRSRSDAMAVAVLAADDPNSAGARVESMRSITPSELAETVAQVFDRPALTIEAGPQTV
ncbi:MAG: insulinase family protein [Candidatus Binataceae bacterium]|nr:insulinase family protein [Candidatus Binataceae bacterium]